MFTFRRCAFTLTSSLAKTTSGVSRSKSVSTTLRTSAFVKRRDYNQSSVRRRDIQVGKMVDQKQEKRETGIV